MRSRYLLNVAALLLAAGLAGCMSESDPDYAEMKELHLWSKKLRAEDPDTGHYLAQECQKEVGFWLSKKGVLEMTRCMRKKYDEGWRWVPDEEATAEV